MLSLVTGGAGLLGNNLIRSLLARGEKVRALVRPTTDPRPLAGLPVEQVLGDVRDLASLRAACAGVGAVFHCAGFVHLGWRDADLAQQINVLGTRNAARAAREAGARLVHVSSTDALGVSTRDAWSDEEHNQGPGYPSPYVRTKTAAEQEVLAAVAAGLDGVITNPGLMFGPWDWKPSSGRMLLAVGKHFVPLAPVGGVAACDVRDVAAGLIAARDRGTAGRRYVLAGHNLSYFDLWKRCARVARSTPPLMRAGPLLRFLGGKLGDAWGWLTGHEPEMNSAALRMSNSYKYFDCGRAQRELGYLISPLETALEDAWRWFGEQGYLGAKRDPAVRAPVVKPSPNTHPAPAGNRGNSAA